MEGEDPKDVDTAIKLNGSFRVG
ncbi:hypothetical protein [Thermoactinomyces sp. CICC 10522]|nr:hypothetical protein [Thermoactinomyces sp. CICC 10522]